MIAESMSLLLVSSLVRLFVVAPSLIVLYMSFQRVVRLVFVTCGRL